MLVHALNGSVVGKHQADIACADRTFLRRADRLAELTYSLRLLFDRGELGISDYGHRYRINGVAPPAQRLLDSIQRPRK